MRLICASCSEVASTARLNVCSTHPRSGSHLAIVTSGSVGPRPMHHQHFCERVVVVLSGSIYYYREPQPPTVGRTFENPDRAKVCTTHYQEPMSPAYYLGILSLLQLSQCRLRSDCWDFQMAGSLEFRTPVPLHPVLNRGPAHVTLTGKCAVPAGEPNFRKGCVSSSWGMGQLPGTQGAQGCPLSDKVTLVASSSLSAAKGSHRTWALPIRTFPQLSSPSTISQGRLHLLPWQTPVPRGAYMSTPHNWRRTCE